MHRWLKQTACQIILYNHLPDQLGKISTNCQEGSNQTSKILWNGCVWYTVSPHCCQSTLTFIYILRFLLLSPVYLRLACFKVCISCCIFLLWTWFDSSRGPFEVSEIRSHTRRRCHIYSAVFGQVMYMYTLSYTALTPSPPRKVLS